MQNICFFFARSISVGGGGDRFEPKTYLNFSTKKKKKNLLHVTSMTKTQVCMTNTKITLMNLYNFFPLISYTSNGFWTHSLTLHPFLWEEGVLFELEFISNSLSWTNTWLRLLYHWLCFQHYHSIDLCQFLVRLRTTGHVGTPMLLLTPYNLTQPSHPP